MVDIAQNLAAVRARIATAASDAARDPDSVALVAVSKTQPPGSIIAALKAGQTVFGENRLQEAAEKWPALKAAFPGARLHLIGPLQRNKARRAVELCDAIETVDSPRLARTLARLMEETGRRPDCYIQANTGEEPQKAGVLPQETDGFIGLCRDELGLPVKGLMCIPPQDEEPSLHFALLAQIAHRNDLSGLSMGMSGDYETAIAFGATLVRVGTAIFGPRQLRPET